MKEKESKESISKVRYRALGIIPIEKETRSNVMLGEKTISYRVFGITIFKKLPTQSYTE